MPNNFHLRKVVNGLVLLVLLSACGVAKSLRDVPNIDQYSSTIPERTQLSDSSFSVGNNFLIKNRQGLWEMYVDGNPLEIGLKTGSLTRELFNFQESIFVDKIGAGPFQRKTKPFKKIFGMVQSQNVLECR